MYISDNAKKKKRKENVCDYIKGNATVSKSAVVVQKSLKHTSQLPHPPQVSKGKEGKGREGGRQYAPWPIANIPAVEERSQEPEVNDKARAERGHSHGAGKHSANSEGRVQAHPAFDPRKQSFFFAFVFLQQKQGPWKQLKKSPGRSSPCEKKG